MRDGTCRLLPPIVGLAWSVGGLRPRTAKPDRLTRLLGIRLAVDDFGTGFSSLDRLRRMPVESLKIDRSFITEMPVATGGTALVAAIIAMSHSLGLTVVAKGVESNAGRNRLMRATRRLQPTDVLTSRSCSTSTVRSS